jgi:large subunit ribosomal protein L21e
MVNKKSVRTRGKLSLSRKFQELKKGQSVALIFEKSKNTNIQKRMQGRTGKVVGKRGQNYMIEVKDREKLKRYIVDSIHLKKIKQTKEQ